MRTNSLAILTTNENVLKNSKKKQFTYMLVIQKYYKWYKTFKAIKMVKSAELSKKTFFLMQTSYYNSS